MSGQEHDVIVFSYGHHFEWECTDCPATSELYWPLDKVSECLAAADYHRTESGAGDAA